MTKHTRLLACALAASVLAAAAAGCGAAREIKKGTEQGFEQGKREGMIEVLAKEALAAKANAAISKDLECTVGQAAEGATATPVSCTGATDDGRPVTLKGTITESAELKKADFVRGTFTGTVAGKTVLRTSCIGPAC
ncbi:hypothetical protein [Actinomadura macrotermitis]|uniref:DUF4333 domain-containing protein n=1 Tax=Actinomadura macrotermitis TaxID=2585200 RepID=A0A7K0BVL3_9ACTN|nr:hypothetical protein [Actinomadura macrotermitis]MQY05220.1 hypothetical protein [Actinomadura macrotermitis]